MNKIPLAGAAVLAAALGAYVLGGFADRQAPEPEPAAPETAAAMVTVTQPGSLSPEAIRGQEAFEAVCAACHGVAGAGRMGFGPPLIHKVYEPSHHGDMAFEMAVANGVRAHHWTFGDMPPQPQVSGDEVQAIIAYVRAVQRANGIN